MAFRVHATARWARLKISPRVFDSYTAFTVVRNPFDRAVSNFHFLLQRPEHHSHRHVRQMTFDEYLKFLKSRRWMRDPTQRYRVAGARGRLWILASTASRLPKRSSVTAISHRRS